MKGILINPKDRTITEVECGEGIAEIYHHIDCTCFDIRTVSDERDVIFFDDEGLLRGDALHFFALGNHAHPFAGRGLILGTSSRPEDEGNHCSTALTVEEVSAMVTFLDSHAAVRRYKTAEAESHRSAAEHRERGVNVIFAGGPNLYVSDDGNVYSD